MKINKERKKKNQASKRVIVQRVFLYLCERESVSKCVFACVCVYIKKNKKNINIIKQQQKNKIQQQPIEAYNGN